MIRLFIGYEHQDEGVIKALIPVLRALGLDAWEFKSSLELGDTFTKQIENEITNRADGVVFLLSKNTLNSNFTLNFEIPLTVERMSHQENFPVFFLVYKEEISLLERLNISIAGIQSYKFMDDKFETLMEIGEKILSKFFDLMKNKLEKELTIKICDRKPMSISENAVLNCKWYEILGEDEEVPEDVWVQLQLIIKKLKHVITSKTTIKTLLIDARLRYTSSFLLGYVFRQPTGFSLNIEYQNQLWTTPSLLKFKKAHIKTLKISAPKPLMQLILNVSLSHSNINAIKDYITSYSDRKLSVLDTRLTLEPKNGLSRASVKNNEVAQDISLQIFERMSTYHKRYSCKDVHLFFNGPYPIAVFLGWLWNKAPQIYLYEFDGEKRTYFEHPYKIKM